MALKDILDEIKKQAEKEVNRLNAERDEMAAKITKEYEEKRKNRTLEMEEKILDNGQKVRGRAKTFAKMETRNHLLRAKRELLKIIFDDAVTKLSSSPQYTEIITALLKKAAKVFNKGIVMAAEGKEAETKQALQKSGAPFQMSEKTMPIHGGFLLESGKVEVNFSFESILEKELWDELELELNRLLFKTSS